MRPCFSTGRTGFPLALITAALFIFMPCAIASSGHHVALVLSGGGARGLAQIGTLKVLEKYGIRPDLIVGTSMGAIIGSLYAAGYGADSIEHIALSFNWGDIFANSAPRKDLFVSQKDKKGDYLFEIRFDNKLRPLLPRSISEGQTFYNDLVPKLAAAQYRCAMNFDSLSIPLRIVATDIVSGKKVIFSNGSLVTAIRASCGIPLVFSPVASDTMLLMDGGLTSNIPVETVAEEFPGYYIIAVDVTSSLWKKEDLNNPVHLVDQIVSVGLTKQKLVEKKLANTLITPDLDGFQNSDFSRIDTLISRGYNATMSHIQAIQRDLPAEGQRQAGVSMPDSVSPPFHFVNCNDRLAQSLAAAVTEGVPAGVLPVPLFRKRVYDYLQQKGDSFARIVSLRKNDRGVFIEMDPGIVRGFAIQGNTTTRPFTITSAMGIRQGDTLKTGMIARAISSLYATDLFKNVNIDVDTNGIVRVILTEKEYWRVRAGLRFDEYLLAEGYIQPAYENLLGLGISASLHLQYGTMREKYAIELLNNHFFSSFFANKVQFEGYITRERIVTRTEYPNIDSTITLVKLDEQTLGKAGFLALLGAQIGKFSMLDGGIRLEQYAVYQSDAFKDPFGEFKRGMKYLMLRLSIDNLDKFPFPEKGQKHYIRIGGAQDIIGANKSFLKIDGSFCQYYTVNKIHTFSPFIQFAWATDSLPDVERVFVGGAVPEEQNREIGVYNYMPFFGLRPRALPGDVVLLIHCNYRLLIQQNIYLTCTLDWGYPWLWSDAWAWSSKKSPRLSALWQDFLDNAPVGMGLGIAYESLIGPIRLSWGRLLKNRLPAELNILSENLFYLSIGHDF
jgi:predicted acylesterase/phospholipase RssA